MMDTKLATIVCSDVIGYSAAMQQDEAGTLAALDACRAVIDPLISEHRGRLFNTGGDSVFVEFVSAVDAVKFAITMQLSIAELNLGMKWRCGIHMGEVWIYGSNLMGEAVNLAARTESLADHGGVTMTHTVYQLVRGKIQQYQFVSRGVQQFKNVDPMQIWSIQLPGSTANPLLTVNQPVSQTVSPTRSHRDLVAAVINDQSAKNRSLADAQALRRDGLIAPAVRVLMHRVYRRCSASLDLLLQMHSQSQIPQVLRDHALAVMDESAHWASSEQAIGLAEVFLSAGQKSRAVRFLQKAALVNDQAQYRLATVIFEDPNSSEAEIKAVIADLIDAAKRKQVPAMMNLARYYLDQQDTQNAFIWLWVARSCTEPQAQVMLEQLIKGLTRAQFENYKTAADAMMDEIQFVTRHS